jgi:putative oxidoreductase
VRFDVAWLLATRQVRAARFAPWVRFAAAAVFVVFGIGKFTEHASELASFQGYGLPAPDTFVYAIGVLELVGGLLLAVGALTRPAALALAGDMVGAIVASGIGEGEVVPSLTVAPAMLAAMLYLVWAGPGGPSVDDGLARRLRALR